MYVVAKHAIRDPATAFPRGERLQTAEGAPEGVRVLQFYPSTDSSQVVCLWESPSLTSLQEYVDTLGLATLPVARRQTATPR